MNTTKNTPTAGRNWWPTLAFVTAVVGVVVPTMIAMNFSLADDNVSARLWLAVFALFGIAFIGIASYLRVGSHGHDANSAKRWDGIARILGLFGWAIGFTSAWGLIVARASGSGFRTLLPLWVIVVVVGMVLVVAAIVWAVRGLVKTPSSNGG